MKNITPTGLAALLLVLVSLAGCGEQEVSQRQDKVSLESTDPTGQQIIFWYQHVRAREEALQEMIAQFNAENPHRIQLRGEFAGRYSDIYNKMVVALQGGSAPDLLVAYQGQALEYYMADGIVDLRPYITSETWGLSQAEEADFGQAFMRQNRIRGGVQTGLPPNRSIEVIYYNVDWLHELGADGPPQTWDEFARLCRAARDTPFSGNLNKQRSLGFILDEDASRLASMVFSRGGNFLNAAGDALRDRLNGIFQSRGVAVQATGIGSMMVVHFCDNPITCPADSAQGNAQAKRLFHLEMIARGQYVVQRGMINQSLPMTDKDRDGLVAAIEGFLDDYREVLKRD